MNPVIFYATPLMFTYLSQCFGAFLNMNLCTLYVAFDGVDCVLLLLKFTNEYFKITNHSKHPIIKTLTSKKCDP